MTQAIRLRIENGRRCVFQGDTLIANIYDHRQRNRKDRYSTIEDDWMVAWTTGRVDWHGSYCEARDNALKGR